jgi:hypothetical protein
VDFESLSCLVELCTRLDLPQCPASFKHTFVVHFKDHTFHSTAVKGLPPSFLKQVGFDLFALCFHKGSDEAVEILRVFGNLMSTDELKKMDLICCENIETMNINKMVRFLNIFRQLQKWGTFVELASDAIAERQG